MLPLRAWSIPSRSNRFCGSVRWSSAQLVTFVEGRFTLVEKLDMQAKRIEADARYRSAEEVWNILRRTVA